MGGPPSAEQVKVATNALRTEAKTWDEQSSVMNTLSTKVAGMEFGRLEAGLFQIMVGPYNEVVSAVSSRCREGTAAMKEIGGTLRTVANTYDAEDKAAEHRNRKIY